MNPLARATDRLRQVLVDAVDLADGGDAGERELAVALDRSLTGVATVRSGRLRRVWLHLRLRRHLDPTAVAALRRAAETALRRGDRYVGRDHLAAALAPLPG